MRQIFLFVCTLLPALAFSQNDLSIFCDQYRRIMDRGMDALGLKASDRQFIIGPNGEYYKPGMSKNFISAPEIPDFGALNAQRNPHIVSIEIAHVNLYYCDVKELEGGAATAEKTEEHLLENLTAHAASDDYILFPNPTDGPVNIGAPVDAIKTIQIFDASGNFIMESAQPKSIDLSDQPANTYLFFINNTVGRVIKKVVKH
jgi:Secretion system C-terminal sorting domain